ncbi:hypothetical protein D9757_003714 [Collybiopsis confluens]|uniref:Uncharacterized protein n=1 Tax=Collybiopsis confluens TaxID=2823264 RepID=A0A8H5HUP4_9AGAR|nr:hypothetical protein D9757_003714 [Collybiopsis confluens]
MTTVADQLERAALSLVVLLFPISDPIRNIIAMWAIRTSIVVIADPLMDHLAHPVCPASVKQCSCNFSPSITSSRITSPWTIRQRIEPGTKVMDVDDPDNNPVEEGASRGSVNEDHNEDRIGPNRPDGNITHEGEADPQEWEMGYAADENNPWKEHPER